MLEQERKQEVNTVKPQVVLSRPADSIGGTQSEKQAI